VADHAVATRTAVPTRRQTAAGSFAK
jgi:hypothetical protein